MTTSLVLWLCASSTGFGDHHVGRIGLPGPCGLFRRSPEADVVILRSSARWRSRDDAAHRLAKSDWKADPEILPALVAALLGDCEEEVREEAAESLGKLAPCVPEVHEGLALAAAKDPDSGVRRQAKKALKSLGRHCEAPCGACDPGVVIERRPDAFAPYEPGLLAPGAAPIEAVPPIPADDLPPGMVVPPSDLPAPLPGPAPFGDVPLASRKKPAANLAREDRRPSPSRGLIVRRRLR